MLTSFVQDEQLESNSLKRQCCSLPFDGNGAVLMGNSKKSTKFGLIDTLRLLMVESTLKKNMHEDPLECLVRRNNPH